MAGGRVGQGGYGGDITVECFTPTEVNQTHGIPFTGTDTRRNQLGAVRLGVYEASGSNGMIGKVTGDVAFIQKSKAKNGSGILYGFEKVEKIAIKMWLESKPTVETNLYVKHENKNYAKLELSSYSASDSPSVSLVDSVKKKSVIRQSLIQRFDQIDERNQLMESIQKMLSNPTEHHSSSIDEIIKKMDNKVHEFHQLTTQRQQNQLEQIQKEQYVKPAIDSSVSIPKSKLIGRRPVWNDNKDVHQLKDNSQKNTNVYCLDELFTEDGSDSALHCLFGQINSEGKYVCNEQRDVDWIIKKMTEDPFNMNVNVKERVVKVLGLPAIEEIDIPKAFKAIETWINHGLDLIDAPSLKKFLDVFDYAVKQKMGFKLRDTQKVTLIILLFNKLISKKELAQVSTGEGKSIIVAGVAIGFALSQQIIKREKNNKKTDKRKNNKIDVITSNDVLALRDSSLSVAEGGLKEIYEFFNVTVSNNCSQFADERTSAYNMDVVYGTLANFQRDYLLDKFYNRNIRGDRPMDFVIIDEADCMLLDRGSNVLYLSHDIPGMETLESLYLFIWAKIQTDKTDENLELIKSAILYDLYGQIKREDLKNIQNNLLGQEELESERKLPRYGII